jgi:hypothetical protein
VVFVFNLLKINTLPFIFEIYAVFYTEYCSVKETIFSQHI